ncbi:unnamed protein product [Linum tenue]|uniref:Trimethylguanosine synthase n=1 Tax=Linum tenue TaxID=586396 RepID=A0AAV0RKP9_9ROSI|nr:unnamed protein product [Linum tenue]
MEEGEEGRSSFQAIRALGSLFKLTEVYIWDDGSTETVEVSIFPESIESPPEKDDTTSDSPAVATDFGPSTEDDELSKQMDALGLPLAFQSNKKIKNKTNKGKRKGAVMKHAHNHDTTANESLKVSKVSEAGTVSPTVLHDNESNSICCISMLGTSESCYYDVSVDTSNSKDLCIEDSESPTKVPPEPMFADQCGECERGLTLSGTIYMTNDDYDEKNTISGGSDAATPDMVDGPKEVVDLMEKDCLHDYPVVHNLQECENHMEWPEFSMAAVPQGSEVLGDNGIESHDQNGAFGDWAVYWDSFYMRNYFYNAKTNNSTWSPPPGMEHLVCISRTNLSDDVIVGDYGIDGDPSVSCGLLKCSGSFEKPANDSRIADQPSNEVCDGDGLASESTLLSLTFSTINGCLENAGEQEGNDKDCLGDIPQQTALEEHGNINSVINDDLTVDVVKHKEHKNTENDEPDTEPDFLVIKRHRKGRRKRTRCRSSKDSEDLQSQVVPEELSASLEKYWCQRYLLFSRFDDGIRMDEEGWFSVTPELIAGHHALHCVDDIVIDCFAGVGGNAIQFAQWCQHVIAIDIDPQKMDYAHHNATIYEVDDHIDFIKGDFFNLAPKLKGLADTVFLSPPWGGPDYVKIETYDINMLKPHDGYILFNTAKQLAPKILMFLPKNVDLDQLAELALSANPPWSLEVEKNFLNGRLKAVTAYFRDTAVHGR